MFRRLFGLSKPSTSNLASRDSIGQVSLCLRRHRLAFACLSSGLIYYRACHYFYNRSNPSDTTALLSSTTTKARRQKQISMTHLTKRPTVFIVGYDAYRIDTLLHNALVNNNKNVNGSSSNPSPAGDTRRADRMVQLRKAVEDDLPRLLDQGLFDLPDGLLDSSTEVWYQTRSSSTLYRLKWIDYRTTFYLSEDGQIAKIKITQQLPPSRSVEPTRQLAQISLWRRLSPSLSGSRRLPTPMPFLIIATASPLFDQDRWISPSFDLPLVNNDCLTDLAPWCSELTSDITFSPAYLRQSSINQLTLCVDAILDALTDDPSNNGDDIHQRLSRSSSLLEEHVKSDHFSDRTKSHRRQPDQNSITNGSPELFFLVGSHLPPSIALFALTSQSSC